jgi:hypothetical protein
MNTAPTWTPATETLTWEPRRGSLACPGCPEHPSASGDGRFEVALEGVGIDGSEDHRDGLNLVRRSPGLVSGPYEVPPLPEGMPALAVIDYLERQTFDAADTAVLVRTLTARFPGSVVHVWAIGPEASHRIAEDASWDESERLFVRTPVFDIAPPDYPMDVGWRRLPEHVEDPDGQRVELWRGCLYVDLERPGLVRYGWSDLPTPGAAVTSTAD